MKIHVYDGKFFNNYNNYNYNVCDYKNRGHMNQNVECSFLIDRK